MSASANQAFAVSLQGLGRAFAVKTNVSRPVLHDLSLDVEPREIVAILGVITGRSNLAVDQVPGPTQLAVLEKIGPTFVELGDVPSQQQVDDALGSIVDDTFAKQADASRLQ